MKSDYNASKLELIEEISKKAPKSLGFSVNTFPDRFWLLDVLNTLDPTNTLLKGDPALEFARKFPEG